MNTRFLYCSKWIPGIVMGICFIYHVNAQNLVPNADFEIYSVCPSNPELVNNAPPWDLLGGGGGGTPDYFNSCATYLPYSVPSNVWGYQYAHSDNAYAFLGTYCATYPNFREYMQVPLIDTLQAGKEYCMKFYVSTADKYKYATDGIGAYFSILSVSGTSNLVLPFTPQVSNSAGNIITDTMNWTKVSGSFIATGGEKYMVIGNFKDDVNTAISIINNGAVNTCAGYYIDDISVMLCSDTSISVNELNNENFKIKLFPNPGHGSIMLNYNLKQNDVAAIKIFDLAGKLVEESELNSNRNELLLTTDLSSGIYLYQVIVNNELIKSDKLVIITEK